MRVDIHPNLTRRRRQQLLCYLYCILSFTALAEIFSSFSHAHFPELLLIYEAPHEYARTRKTTGERTSSINTSRTASEIVNTNGSEKLRIENLEGAKSYLFQLMNSQQQSIDDLKDLVKKRHEVQQNMDDLQQMKRHVAQLNHEWYKRRMTVTKAGLSQIFKDDYGHQFLNPFYEHNGTFCLSWNVNSDDWWTHHVDWDVTRETDDGYCFSPLDDFVRAALLRMLYDVQFRGNCEQARTKRMWSTGWGADFANIVDGLRYALETNQPTTMANHAPWLYSANRDGSSAACPEKGLKCYFLPLSRCEPDPRKAWPGVFYGGKQPSFLDPENIWITMYATRQQTWLRKEVYEFSKRINLTLPCTVIHVRRGDVVLDTEWSRRYIPLEEYVNATEKITKTIFLLSDDDNAIREAKAQYPDIDWVVIDRPRFKGSEGGWEGHIPSKDPKSEVIVLLSIFHEAPKCSVFVHGHSNLSEYIAGLMMRKQMKDLVRVDLNENVPKHKVFNLKNAYTVNLSRSKWRL